MVAISLYKGNLHKVPEVPRRWPRPETKMSLKDFKLLLERRARTLTRLRSFPAELATTSNPSPDPGSASAEEEDKFDPIPDDDNEMDNVIVDNHVHDPRSGPESHPAGDLADEETAGEKGEVKDEKFVDEEDSWMKLMKKVDASEEEKNGMRVKKEVEADVPVNPAIHIINTEEALSDVEKRKKDILEKLEILNEKKHSLVQVLKQILNAEEQLKRQNSAQAMLARPPLPLQVDTSTDSGSVAKVNTPRMGSDANPFGDMEGETEDVSNHNTQPRHIQRTSSVSPSSDSQQRKSVSNMAPQPHRTMLGAVGSPSRFAPPGQVASLVSVSGSSYIASSPSPAASGGTSVFKDGRLSSPRN